MDFLAKIAADRRRRVDELRRDRPEAPLRAALAPAAPAGRLERALRRASAGQPIRLLCEVKRASPSRGLLNDRVDPVATALLYAAGGAAAISLVTEPDHFLGELAWVDLVRPRVTLPLLLKDFVVDGYQLVDAASRGADAVLLLAALLGTDEMRRFIAEARALGLDCLVEVHDEEELERALLAGAAIVGINNRSLRTFEVDLATSLRLLPRLPSAVVARSEERRVGKECVTQCRSRWSPYH